MFNKKNAVKTLAIAASLTALIVLTAGSVGAASFSFWRINSWRVSGVDLKEVYSLGSRVGDFGTYATTTPIGGGKFLVFSGWLNGYSGDAFDYRAAFYTFSGGEENSYRDYVIQRGDQLAFSTFTAYDPGCGLDIEFTDGTQAGWNYYDQNGYALKDANSGAKGKWYERRVDLSNLSGKKIKNIVLAMEAHQDYAEYFECYFDGLRIYNATPSQPVCSDSDGGLDIYNRGLTDNRVNGIGSYNQDTCLSLDKVGTRLWKYNAVYSCSGSNCYIQEGYCNGKEVTNKTVRCVNGCYNGACVR